uniref:Uncharacterized protein n=1 Tax=Romanomermis culicivorax TaxID=13658 RepID=A0A915HNJ8_ROMCU
MDPLRLNVPNTSGMMTSAALPFGIAPGLMAVPGMPQATSMWPRPMVAFTGMHMQPTMPVMPMQTQHRPAMPSSAVISSAPSASGSVQVSLDKPKFGISYLYDHFLKRV